MKTEKLKFVNVNINIETNKTNIKLQKFVNQIQRRI